MSQFPKKKVQRNLYDPNVIHSQLLHQKRDHTDKDNSIVLLVLTSE